MVDDTKKFDDEDMTAEDRAIQRLYERSATSDPWDESDDAILAAARSIHRKTGSGDEAVQDNNPDPAPEAGDKASDTGNVVSFADRKKKSGWSLQRSPIAGLAMAASLFIGIFMGQGLTPYFDLGVAPSYKEIKEENKQLQEEVVLTRSLQRRQVDPGETSPANPTPPTIASSTMDLLKLTETANSLECANVYLNVSAGPSLEVAGYVGSEADMQTLTNSMRESDLSPFRNVATNVDVFDWPLCQAMQVLGARTLASENLNDGPVIRPLNHSISYRGGEDLVLEIIAGAQGGYLTVDFVQHDGTIVHLLPFDLNPNNQLVANERITIGEGAQRYTLTPPFGTEMIYIVQTPERLFPDLRPEIEPAKEYLEALSNALQSQRQKGLANQILSDVLLINTSGG